MRHHSRPACKFLIEQSFCCAAHFAANPIVIEAYWNTGKIILARQEEAGWGSKVIDRLAIDLQAEFPDMGGLSVRNLLAMKIFAREFPAGPIAQQPVAQFSSSTISSAVATSEVHRGGRNLTDSRLRDPRAVSPWAALHRRCYHSSSSRSRKFIEAAQDCS